MLRREGTPRADAAAVAEGPGASAVRWLLESDPAIRWQVMRDLTDEPAEAVTAERARVAREGWGARLLALQGPDGQWGGGTYFPEGLATTPTLQLLRDFGLDPDSPEARRAIAPVRENSRWEHEGQQYFDGEVEPCINGAAVAIGAYFRQDVKGIVDRLLTEQMADGGWNCEQERGSTRGSFNSTISVLEGLLEYERSAGGGPEVKAAPPRPGVPPRAPDVPSRVDRRGDPGQHRADA